MKIKAVLFIAFTALLLSAAYYTNTEVRSIIPNELVLDGRTYTDGNGGIGKHRLIENFLLTATATSFGKPGAMYYTPLSARSEISDFYNPEIFKRNYPWLYPYLYETKDHPSLLSINKWVKPVRISLGLPNRYQSFGKENKAFGYFLDVGNNPKPPYRAARAWVEDESSRMAPILSDLTNLDIAFIAEELPNDPTSISNVRIILMDDVSSWETKFKTGNRNRTTSLRDWDKSWIAIEPHLVTRIPFTPEFVHQVNGYYISNADNEIQFSVCYIWTGHEEAMVKKLTQECLVRSLGFQGFNTIHYHDDTSKSVLYSWNDPYDSSPEIDIKAIAYEPRLTDLDQFFIKTLYSPAIKPGMDYMSVFKLLVGNEKNQD